MAMPALWAAAGRGGGAAEVTRLLAGGALIEETGGVLETSPLLCAASTGSREAVKILLEHGANVKAKGKDGWTSLHIAASRGNVKLARLLLIHGAVRSTKTDLGRNGQTALQIAVASRKAQRTKVAKLLRDYRCVPAVTPPATPALPRSSWNSISAGSVGSYRSRNLLWIAW
ncbi:ankyrin repeat-containing domain protein [Baffinella frigidus]|nr:ankyrin repeat-containing domain protein [Cryptophyta sp. CCMP2293]